MVATGRRFAGPIIGFLVGAGLEVSPFEDIRIAIGLWSLATLWALFALITWPELRQRLPLRRSSITVETRGFEGIPLHPDGYGWLIPSVTITNLTTVRMKVDATLRVGERQLPAARKQEEVNTKVQPPNFTEARLALPADVPSRDAVNGALVFVMSGATYRKLPPDVRSTLSTVTKVLEVKDLVSNAAGRATLPPENQTIIVQPIVLSLPSRYQQLRRRIREGWERLVH